MVRKGWQPLWTHGGGGSGSSRPASVPTLVTAERANPFIYYNDFLSASIGPAAATYGHFDWLSTAIGTVGAGTVGCGYTSSDVGYSGWLQLASGATSGDGMMIDLANRSSGTNSQGVPLRASATRMDWIGQWRFQHVNGATARSYGMGWLSGVDAATVPGTNWVTDPDTTLASSSGVVIHSDTAAYGTLNAGVVGFRVYDTFAGLIYEGVLIASPVTNQVYKVEVVASYDESSGEFIFKVYVDNVLTITTPGLTITASASGDMLRPSAGIVVAAGTARTLQIDSYYHEIAQPSLR